jgi:basic amino acid/polyamine antiporter, APA family
MSTSSSTKISLATATIVGMNAMIGSGIFTAPAAIASYVGPAGIVAYIFVVLSVWCMALSLARLAELFPQDGSFYTYTRQWAGHTGGLIASGLYLFGLMVAMGLLSQVSGMYLASFFPSVSPTILGLLVLAALVCLNVCGVALSEIGQQILIVTTVFPLIAIIILCLSQARFSNFIPFAPYGFGNILKATKIVIFGFFGYECAASLFNVVENPARNVPKALTYSIAVVGVLYTLFITAIILATPLELFKNPCTPLSDTLGLVFPQYEWLLVIVHIAILSAIIGTIHSMIWSSGALLLSLARTTSTHIAELFSAQDHNAHRAAVLIVSASIVTTFSLISNMNLFFSLTAICIIAAQILSLITLLLSKKEWQSGQNIITVIGICTALTIFYFAVEGIGEVVCAA